MSQLSTIIRNHQTALGGLAIGSHAQQITTSKVVNGRTAYWREPVLNLETAISEARSELTRSGGQRLRRIKLYSDAVTWTESTTFSFEGDTRFTIWAREVSDASSLKLKMEGRARFYFHTTSLPAGFTVHAETSDGTKRDLLLVIPQGYLGVCLIFSDTDVEVEYREPDDEDFNATGYLDYLTPEGKLSEGYVEFNDNLLRLLQFQFIIATAHMRRTPQLAKSLLQYIITVTSRCRDTADVFIQASSMLSTIQDSGSLTSFVPNLNLSVCKSVLKARLLAAQTFETLFLAFMKEDKDAKKEAMMAGLTLAASNDAMIQYSFLGNQAQIRYNSATVAYMRARENFQALQTELSIHGAQFRIGIEIWKVKKTLEAVGNIILSIITVAGGIASAIVSVGSIGASIVAVPAGLLSAATGGVTTLVTAATTAVDTFQRIITIFERLVAFFEKIRPALENAQKLVESIIRIVALLEKFDNATDLVTTSLIPSISSSDAVNGAAEWDTFAVDIRYLFEDLSTESIQGMRDYHRTLEKIPILGKAVISAQTLVIQTGEEWTRMKMQQKMSERQSARIAKAISYFEGDSRLLEATKRAMFDKLLVVRSWVFMDFWSYAGAYMYYSLAKDLPIRISATKPAEEYPDDAARLQGAIASFKSTTSMQMKRFEINTGTSSIFGATPLVDFETNKQITFTIDLADPLFQQFCRVRVSKIRFYVEGAITAPDDKLQLSIQTTPEFSDRDVTPPHDPRAFVREPRIVVFEYDVNTKDIEMDGVYTNAEDYTRVTPFTEWTIEAKQPGVVFGTLTELKMEMWCEVTFI